MKEISSQGLSNHARLLNEEIVRMSGNNAQWIAHKSDAEIPRVSSLFIALIFSFINNATRLQKYKNKERKTSEKVLGKF